MAAAATDGDLFGVGEDIEDDDEMDQDDDEIDDEDEGDEEEEDEMHVRDAEENSNRRKSESENGISFPSTSSSTFYFGNPQNAQIPNPNFQPATVVVSLPAQRPANATLSSPDSMRLKAVGSYAVEDSRRICQRLWTDEDEVSLLKGFFDYTMERHRRGGRGGSTNYDIGTFYDQIRTRLQLDFNKNQLVEKLRRLKKKYRNAVSRMRSGRDFSFKSPHDQITFELSKKIWNNAYFDDNEDQNEHPNSAEVKQQQQSWKNAEEPSATTQPRMEDSLPNFIQAASPAVPNTIEDAVKSCLSPLFKELLHCIINSPSNSAVGGVPMNLLPLNFVGSSLNLSKLEAVDERWRKQQILELEVYSKRLELVQEQVKSALEELKSTGS